MLTAAQGISCQSLPACVCLATGPEIPDKRWAAVHAASLGASQTSQQPVHAHRQPMRKGAAGMNGTAVSETAILAMYLIELSMH